MAKRPAHGPLRHFKLLARDRFGNAQAKKYARSAKADRAYYVFSRLGDQRLRRITLPME